MPVTAALLHFMPVMAFFAVATLLSLLFGAFAVAIKLAIVQRLQREAPPAALGGLRLDEAEPRP